MGEARAGSAHPVWAGTASVVVLGLVLLLVGTIARADARMPAGALAVVSSTDTSDATAYGQADPCPVCDYAYSNWSYLEPYVVADRGDGRVLTGHIARSTLRISTFSATTFRLTSRRAVTFAGWRIGGALIARDGYVYVLLGRANPRQENARIVIEVRKLDRRLNPVGAAQISGRFDSAGIYEPFEATSSSLALSGTTLVVHSARLIYHLPGDSAPHHQVNLAFSVDPTTMAPEPILGRPYASHSFRQFVRAQGDSAVFLNHGDAYPRAVQVGVVPHYFTPDHGQAVADLCRADEPLVSPAECDAARDRAYRVFDFDGTVGDNYTGTTVNGFEVGPTHALTTGLSVPHGQTLQGVSGSSPQLVRNAYLVSTDTALGTSRFIWLTTYRPQTRNTSLSQPQLVPVGPDRFAILFTTKRRKAWAMRYVLVNEAGDVLATRTWPGKRFTALGQPVVVGTRLFWVGFGRRSERLGDHGGHYLYGLDIRGLTAPKLLRR